MGSLMQEIRIDTAAKEVWKVLSDLSAIWRWNSAVVTSYSTSLQNRGFGAERYCYLGNGHFIEEKVISWQEHERLTTKIVRTSLPFKSAYLQFEIRQVRESTVVTASSAYELEFALIGRILDALFIGPTYAKHIAQLLAGLKRHVEFAHGGNEVPIPLSRKSERTVDLQNVRPRKSPAGAVRGDRGGAGERVAAPLARGAAGNRAGGPRRLPGPGASRPPDERRGRGG